MLHELLLTSGELAAGPLRLLRGFDADTGDGLGLTFRLINDTSLAFNLSTDGILYQTRAVFKGALISNISLFVEVSDRGKPSKSSIEEIHIVVRCSSNREGPDCGTCVQGYGGSTCARCQPCSTNGVCGEQGICQCLSERFTGPRCTDCAAHLYGPDCQKLPWLIQVQPDSSLDIGGTSITFQLDNVNLTTVQLGIVCAFGNVLSRARKGVFHSEQ